MTLTKVAAALGALCLVSAAHAATPLNEWAPNQWSLLDVTSVEKEYTFDPAGTVATMYDAYLSIGFAGFSLGGAPSVTVSFDSNPLSYNVGTSTYTFAGLIDGGLHTIKVSPVGYAFGVASLNASVTAAPVPEPETYAMMLAGLGAIGFMARRRQAK